MSYSRWDDNEGITPWRSAGPTPLGELFLAATPDYTVADMLALSGALPVSVHLYPPPAECRVPYLLVEPVDATERTPPRRVRVSLVDAQGEVIERPEVPWDPDEFDSRKGLGDVIRGLAPKLAELSRRGG